MQKLLYLILLLGLICINSLYGQNYEYSTDDTVEIEQVVITGNRVQVAKENVPLTISVIDEKSIEQSQDSKILSLISKKVPGVFVTERGVTGYGLSQGSAGHINVRGIGSHPNTQVLMLIDGHPQYMGIFGHPLPDSYVTSDVEKVEVIRGPASILYGSNAMGGVINLITNKQEEEGFHGGGQAMYGSYNTQKYTAKGGYKSEKFNVFASVNHDRTNGHRDSSDFNITNGYIKTGYELNEHLNIKADFSLSAFESQDPGLINQPAGNFIDILRGRGSFSLENSYEKIEGGLKLYHNFGEHEISNGFHSTDRLSGLMLHQTLRLIPNNMITIGADYKNYGGMAENTKFNNDIGEEYLDEMAGYALIQHTFFSKLVLNGGLRIENNEMYGTEILPQTGFAYHPFKTTTIKGSFAKGFRSPTMNEFFLFGFHNKDLEPERINNYELGFIQKLFNQRMDFELTGFYIDGSNMIQTNQQRGIYLNTGEFTNYGIETAVNYKLNENLQVNTNYSYLYTEKQILGAPEHKYYLGVNYSFKNIQVNLNVEHINDLYTQAPERETYTLLNSRITYNQSESLGFFLSAENLTGTDYHITFGYPMPETTLFGGIKFDF
jgi:iron complex outermembrane receptor protein